MSSTPWPLALGTVELADGRQILGFVCQSGTDHSAIDITAHGGWRAYLHATDRHPTSEP